MNRLIFILVFLLFECDNLNNVKYFINEKHIRKIEFQVETLKVRTLKKNTKK